MVLFVCGSYFPFAYLPNYNREYRGRNGTYVGNVVPLNSITSDIFSELNFQQFRTTIGKQNTITPGYSEEPLFCLAAASICCL